MFKYFTCILFFIVSTNNVHASEVNPTSIEQANLSSVLESHTFQNLGSTTFSILFWDIYKSKLMSTSGEYPVNVNADKLIYQIEYLADISSDDLILRTVDQWEHLGISNKIYKDYLPQLKRIWPDIKAGDTLALLYQDQKSTFYFNDIFIGNIDNDAFGQIFLDIWLDEKTSQPTLRKELLGESLDKS
jgi:hypothetical protein